MAERRMFAKTIIDSDAFLDMPLSTQCLYFHLNMRADDDGFINNPKKIMRMIGSSDDDLKILATKKFIIPFDSGIVVIKHWKIHNYIAKDRYTETKYKEEKSILSLDENNSYTLGDGMPIDIVTKKKEPLSEARQKRLIAKKESDLPYSFEYKIRQEFVGENCPICGCVMNYENNLTNPTIQHNKPISLGGKHEIDNISVICNSCNTSIQNKKETPPYNTELVKEKWECVGNVSGMYTQVSIDKNSIDKNSIDKNSCNSIMEFYNNNIGSITPYQLEILESYLKDMEEEVIILAMKKSVEANKRNIQYIKAILNNWIKKGIKTVLDAENEEQEYKNKQKPKEETIEERIERYKREWGEE